MVLGSCLHLSVAIGLTSQLSTIEPGDGSGVTVCVLPFCCFCAPNVSSTILLDGPWTSKGNSCVWLVKWIHNCHIVCHIKWDLV